MGSVWLARRADEKLVAVKTLKPALADDARVASLFLREMRVASAIRHPNVVAVHATGTADETPFFEMEWVEGLTVRSLTRIARDKGHAVPISIALRIAHDACEGLHAAHELRTENGEHLALVHRDVSPHNILVSHEGISKIIDFGVAKAAQAATGDTTSSGGVKGKIRYMAPEQALGKPTVDRRADIFGLGAVLFELLTGDAPFRGENDVDVLRTLVSKAPAALPDDLAAPLAALLSRALAKRPDDRFATARDFAEGIAVAALAMNAIASDRDVAAHVAHVEALDSRRLKVMAALAADMSTLRWKRRFPTRVASMVGAVVVAGAALGFTVFGARSAAATQEPAPMTTNFQANANANANAQANANAGPVETLAPNAIELPARPPVKKSSPPRPARDVKDPKPNDLTTSLHSRR